jgi:hypothetical protein
MWLRRWAERLDKQLPDRQTGREADRQMQIDRKSKIDWEKGRGYDKQECIPQRTKISHL